MMQVILQPPGLMPRFGLGGLPLNLLWEIAPLTLTFSSWCSEIAPEVSKKEENQIGQK